MKYSKLVLSVLVFTTVSLAPYKALACGHHFTKAERLAVAGFHDADTGDLMGDEWSVELTDAQADYVTDAINTLQDPDSKMAEHMVAAGYDSYTVFEGMSPIEAADWVNAVADEMHYKATHPKGDK